MKKKLIWRMSKLPTVEELLNLVNAKLLTQDEAKEILFSSDDELSKKDLQSEIKFLRELVEKLSNNTPSTIVEQIRYIQKPYYIEPWWGSYNVWCDSGSLTVNTADSTGGMISSNDYSTLTVGCSGMDAQATAFNEIKTF